MRYRMLDTNLLVMLDILLDSRSITRTAEALGLSQPAVSSALARLRTHFEDDLLVQVGRSNFLTPLADQLRAPLRDVLTRTDALISRRAGFDPKTDQRRFSFLGSDYVGSMFGNEIMREVALAGEHLAVEHEVLRQDSLDRFERGEIDTVVAPRQIAFEGHPTLDLFEEKFACVVWSGNPVYQDSITAEQYVNARHIVHRLHGDSRVTILDQWFLAQSDIKRKVAVQVSSFSDMLEILPGTPFIATAQCRLAEKLSRRLPIRVLPAPFDFPVMPIIMQWHRHLDDDAGQRWFRDKVQQVVRGLRSDPFA